MFQIWQYYKEWKLSLFKLYLGHLYQLAIFIIINPKIKINAIVLHPKSCAMVLFQWIQLNSVDLEFH